MTKSQKLLVEQSERRERINVLLGQEEMSTEERTELGTLTTRMQAIEPELRAAITVEAAELAELEREHGIVGDPEVRARMDLRGRARLSNGTFLLPLVVAWSMAPRPSSRKPRA